ncbi:MAG: BREX system ATP-binding domain-containing protein [Aggregatilineales bacterium]
MTHLIVQHKLLGTARLLRSLDNGLLLEVQFDSGLRLRLPSAEFEPLPVTMPYNAFETRQTIETLRMGIVPSAHITDLTIGLDEERTRLQRAFKRTSLHGGATLAVLADYGHGKTHFIALTEQSALQEGFLVSSISLDQRELPPSRARFIYSAALEALRYPDLPERGLTPLLERARQQPEATTAVLERSPMAGDCPFAFGVWTYLRSESDAERHSAMRYLTHRGSLRRAPRLMATGAVARQYAYLFSALSTLARALGYSGFALLIDEVDYYSRLTPAAKERAQQLFKALIYASQGEDGTALVDYGIPYHQQIEYPLRFSDQSAFFFMFASTYPPEQMPIADWLSHSLLIYPNQRFKAPDVERFLKMIGVYHAQAYRYQANGQLITPTLVRLLTEALNRNFISVRDLTQIGVTFYDLLYTRPHIPPEDHIRALARALHDGT